MNRSSERVQVSPVTGVISHCPGDYVFQNIISESYRNNPNNRDNLAALAAASAAQNALSRALDTCAARNLNKTAYPFEAEGNATTRKKRVLDYTPRIPARCPAGSPANGVRP